MAVSLPLRSTKINGVDITSQANTWSDLQTFNDGITGSGDTGSLTAGPGILGSENTWGGEQIFSNVIYATSDIRFSGQGGASFINANMNFLFPESEDGYTWNIYYSPSETRIFTVGIGPNNAGNVDIAGSLTVSEEATFNDGITGSGNTGSLTAGPGILGNPNTWTAEQTFNDGITGSGNTGSLTAGPGILGTANTWTALQTFNDGISINSDYDTGDYLGPTTVTERQGAVSLGSNNIVTFDTGYDTMVIAMTTGTISVIREEYWYHLYAPVFMGLFKSGGYVQLSENATYFWTSI